MGLKGKPAKSTSVSGSAQDWAKPYATQGAQDVLNVFNAQQPNLDALSRNVSDQLAALRGQNSAFGQQAGQIGSRVASYGNTAGQGNRFLGDVISGDYMSGNPYIRNIMGQMGEQILGDVGSAFSSAGRYGSGAYTGTLADSLGDAYSRLLYSNYSDEANRRMQAAGMADQALVGQQNAQTEAQRLQLANQQQQLAGTQLASQIPYTGMTSMANSLGALFGGGTSTQTAAKPGILDYMMGAANSAASLGWSPFGK